MVIKSPQLTNKKGTMKKETNKKGTMKKKANKKILLAHKRIQKAYEVIDEIKQKDEKRIIHCLFQDLSDKLLDNC